MVLFFERACSVQCCSWKRNGSWKRPWSRVSSGCSPTLRPLCSPASRRWRRFPQTRSAPIFLLVSKHTVLDLSYQLTSGHGSTRQRFAAQCTFKGIWWIIKMLMSSWCNNFQKACESQTHYLFRWWNWLQKKVAALTWHIIAFPLPDSHCSSADLFSRPDSRSSSSSTSVADRNIPSGAEHAAGNVLQTSYLHCNREHAVGRILINFFCGLRLPFLQEATVRSYTSVKSPLRR